MFQVQTSNDGIDTRRGKLRIIKNLLVICMSICLLFTAYDGLSMLQSTMNKEQGIGTVSQAVLYFGFCVSSLLLPKYVIKKVGCKVTLIMSTSFFIPYIAANFYPHWGTMMPAALLMGIGASLLWGSQCTYFNESALMFCTLTEASEERQGPKIKKPPMSRGTSVEVLSVRNTSDELDPPFKSTEELVANEMAQNFENFYESPRKVPVSQQNSVGNGSLKTEGSSTKRRFSVTLIAGDLENVSKSAETSTVPNGNELNLVPDGANNSVDSLYSSNNEVVCTNPNPRKSVGYIEALQKFRGLESVTARFFGLSGFALHSAQIWSNLLSYYVLRQDLDQNITRNISCACGADFCNSDPTCLEEGIEAIGDDVRYLLTGISVILSVLAVLILAILLNPLPADKEAVTFSFRLILATFNHCRRSREQQFLIFISFYVGMIQGFYTADFTKSFVGCAWGTSHVGLVTIYYGIACAFAATTSGLMVKYIGRIPLMAIAQAFNVGVNILLLKWNPDPEQKYLFYVAAAMWGIVLGTFWALLPSFYGMIFKKDEEAAFGAYYLWSSLGWFLSFSYSDYICTSLKMYILLAMSTVGFTGYLITERMYYVKRNQISLKYAD